MRIIGCENEIATQRLEAARSIPYPYSITSNHHAGRHADVLELADKLVSEASGLNRPCGFKSHHPH